MEVRIAKVIEKENMSYLALESEQEVLEIPLNEDKPYEIKMVFNKLIIDLKRGIFKYDFQMSTSSLYDQLSKEYVTQLNREIANVRKEMESLGMCNE